MKGDIVCFMWLLDNKVFQVWFGWDCGMKLFTNEKLSLIGKKLSFKADFIKNNWPSKGFNKILNLP